MDTISKMFSNMIILIPFCLLVTWFIFFSLPSLLSRIDFFSNINGIVDILTFGWYSGGKSGRVMVAIVFAGTTIIIMYSGLRLIGAGHDGAAMAAVASAILFPLAAVLWP